MQYSQLDSNFLGRIRESDLTKRFKSEIEVVYEVRCQEKLTNLVERKVFVKMPQRDWHKNPKEKENTIAAAWNVFDNVKTTTKTPEALMAEINAAISNLEYARTTAWLESPMSPNRVPDRSSSGTSSLRTQYDVRMADEAYKAGCAALAVGKLDEALLSLNVSLSKCPPEKSAAVAKLQSLISLTSQQLQVRSSNSHEISQD